MDLFWELMAASWCPLVLGVGGGWLLSRWWNRVHGPREGPAGAGLLALLVPNMMFGLFGVILVLVPLVGYVESRPAEGGPFDLDLLPMAVTLIWALATRFRRSPAGLWMVAIALLPFATLNLLSLALATGEITLNPRLDADGWHLDLSGAAGTFAIMFGALVGLGRPVARNEPSPPLPVPDPDGVVRFTFRTRPSETSYLLAFLAMVLVVPGIVLFLRPSLWTSAVTVRIWGEAVEIDDGQCVRLAMSGGSVRRSHDILGSPVLELIGRDGTHTLRLGGVPEPLVNELVNQLEAATRVTEQVPSSPAPDALHRLRGRVHAVEG